ncbi:MAG: hypothetical protein GY796_24980, partial [Chloroflexi bacterium]|nr:hypothetical protein [Chloroflexota bacterium]
DLDTTYQILIEGQLGERWADWFEGMDISHNEQGSTVLTGLVADQAELQGILATIGMLNMTLISVTQINVKSSKASQTNQDEGMLSD